VIKSNRKYFEAASPSILMDVLDKKEKEIEKDKKNIRKIIPELDALRLLSKDSQEVTLFKGFGGIKSVLENIFSAKEVFIIVSSIFPSRISISIINLTLFVFIKVSWKV